MKSNSGNLLEKIPLQNHIAKILPWNTWVWSFWDVISSSSFSNQRQKIENGCSFIPMK
jgi:hypothetical protein